MKRLFIIAAIAAMFCTMACEPASQDASKEDGLSGILGLPTYIDVGYIFTPSDIFQTTTFPGDELGNDPLQGLSINDFNLNFSINTHRGGKGQKAWSEDNSELIDKVQSLMFEHNEEKIAYKYEEREREELIRRYGENSLVLFGTTPTTVQFYYGQIEELVLTADQTLWGVESGGNLIDKFKLVLTRPNLLISYEDGSLLANTYFNDKSEDFMPYLSKSLIPAQMSFKMIEPFEERPERVWFTMEVRFKGFDAPQYQYGNGCYFKYD